MHDVERWIETSPYTAGLGVRVRELEDQRLVLDLPFREENSNPGRALHGGVAASLVAAAGQALARAAHGPAAAPWHTAALQVSYLSAALGEDVLAEAQLLRAGKELAFAEVEVRSASGRAVAHGTTAVHARFGAPPAKAGISAGDEGGADPGPMGPHIERVPFMQRLGLRVEHMQEGRSRIRLPDREENHALEGGVHEGALLGLFDTTGAMAAWALTGPGRYKASTPGLQAQILMPPPRDTLIGYGRVVQRDRELFWSEVEIAAASTRERVARGTVIYRIVVPEAQHSEGGER